MRSFLELAREAARLATGRLGWLPGQFWEATPAELRLALEGRFGTPELPLGRGDLERLKERLG